MIDRDDDAPRPTFLDSLEWQIRSEVRRRAAFDAGRPALGRSGRWLGRLIPLAASVALGAGGVLAAGRLRERPFEQLIRAKAEILEATAAEERKQLAEILEVAERQVAAGVASSGEAEEVRLRLAAADARLARCRLDLEEIDATGRAPWEDLGAPAVGGRDFVAERLDVDRRLAAQEAASAAARRERADAMVAAGVLSSREAAALALEQSLAARRAEEIGGRLELRARVLAGGIPPERAELLAMRNRTALEHEAAGARWAAERKAVDEKRALHQAGMLADAELREAELRLGRIQADARLAEAELEILERRLSD